MRGLGGAIAVALAMTLSCPAYAEPTPEEKESARTLLDQGDARIEAGDVEGALRAYEAADLVMNVPTTAIEVAKTRARLGRLILARDAARRVQAFPASADEPDAFVAARAEARTILSDLEKRIAVLTLTPGHAPPKTIELRVDDVARPFAPQLELDPGKHRIVATSRGVTVTHQVDLGEGQRKQIALALGSAPTSDATTPRFLASPVFWLGASVAVSGAGVAIGAGVASASLTSDIEAACPDLDRCDPALRDDYDEANTLANVSNVSFGVMGAGLVVALIGVIVAETSDDPPMSTRGLVLRF